MSGLAEFLLARCDDEQKRANDKWQRPHWGHCNTQGDYSSLGDECDCGLPARVLAECEARRRIVEQYAEYLDTVRAYRSPRWSDAMNEQDKENARKAEARHRVAEDVARLLALPYADHPDYDPSWRV